MNISNKVKSLLKLKGKDYKGLATHIGINEQSLRNKFVKGCFAVSDLIKVAEYLDCELGFIMDGKPHTMLTIEDITKKDE